MLYPFHEASEQWMEDAFWTGPARIEARLSRDISIISYCWHHFSLLCVSMFLATCFSHHVHPTLSGSARGKALILCQKGLLRLS